MPTDRKELKVYMVDRYLQGMSLEQLSQAQKAVIKTSQQFTAGSRPVRYLRSTYLPGESRLMCLFEGPDASLVRAVNNAAGALHACRGSVGF